MNGCVGVDRRHGRRDGQTTKSKWQRRSNNPNGQPTPDRSPFSARFAKGPESTGKGFMRKRFTSLSSLSAKASPYFPSASSSPISPTTSSHSECCLVGCTNPTTRPGRCCDRCGFPVTVETVVGKIQWHISYVWKSGKQC
jgi:hypothetical protein